MKSEDFLLEKQKLKAHKRGLVTRRERKDALEELVKAHYAKHRQEKQNSPSITSFKDW